MVKIVNVLIGTACDMNCPYCLQTGEDILANRTPDIDGFVRGLVEHTRTPPATMCLWGGEPLLYMKRIRPLLETLRRAGFFPQKILITTNGRKMDRDYVGFANANPVWTVVSSHDWRFSEQAMQNIFSLDRFSISSIITHENLSLMPLRDRFYDFVRLFGRFPRLYCSFVRATKGCDARFYLTHGDVDSLVDEIKNEVLPLARAGSSWARWQLSQILHETRKSLAKPPLEAKCFGASRLSVDLHGNIYGCHHNFDASNIVGNIFKKSIPIRPVESVSPAPERYSTSAECRACPIFDECRGGCYLSATHDVDCYLARRMHEVTTLYENEPWRSVRTAATPFVFHDKPDLKEDNP